MSWPMAIRLINAGGDRAKSTEKPLPDKDRNEAHHGFQSASALASLQPCSNARLPIAY